MAYVIASTLGPSELGGKYKFVSKVVTPDAATGNVIFTEFAVVDRVVGCGFNADLTANCYTIQAVVDVTVTNQVNFKLWKAGGTAADTAFVPFTVTVLAH